MLRLTLLVCLAGVALGYRTGEHHHYDSDDSFERDGGATDQLWEDYKTTHGKSYSASEDAERKAIFDEALREIQQHNAEADLGQHTYHVGLNHLSDYKPEELSRLYGFIANADRELNHHNHHHHHHHKATKQASQLPASVDWNQAGWVTNVKDQGSCGSCYTFASCGALEGQLYNTTGNLISLSEQNLIDCSTVDGNHGCNGGTFVRAFTYVQQNGGLDTLASYPYLGENGTCAYTAANAAPGLNVKYWINIAVGSEAALQDAVATMGPVAVAIDASQPQFGSFKTGVFQCTTTPNLNHGVLVVGYGTYNGQDYWQVKNSWGTSYGQNGYVWIARNSNNPNANCGIANQACIPFLR